MLAAFTTPTQQSGANNLKRRLTAGSRLALLPFLAFACGTVSEPGTAGSYGMALAGGDDYDVLNLLQTEKLDGPGGYYEDINFWDADQELVRSLHRLLSSSAKNRGYGFVWTAFQKLDLGTQGCAEDEMGDIYSLNCWIPAEDQCGLYKNEGDCYNREHSWPKSWFKKRPAPTADLHHLFPTDGKVNCLRDNHPFAMVSSPTYTSTNGSKIGPSDTRGFTGKAFEPIDDMKGDIARAYFYMSVRYQGAPGWKTSKATDGTHLKEWQEDLLREWHEADPVDDVERARNERIFELQGNRNPFVDYPALVDSIEAF